VVLEGPVTVVTEVPFPHLSPGKTASACPELIRQLLGAQPWEWRIQDLQCLLPKEENSNHLGLADRERATTALLEGFSFPELREEKTESHRLQGRCSTNHPRCKQKELEVLGTFDHNLYKLIPKKKETPPRPSLQGTCPHQKSLLEVQQTP
ncbi:hypothetical protein DV515_00011469, partial [Chloebia gouldiae]